ncbi:MAG: histidine phosphatase family protein [Mariniphaga sp.]|nr:histidine phosphatase family protein [Mariniphaga sp.]MDD4224803.1 histidine phosphatase family protein [Mariniphaga sp.]MDD4426748.1 histidine phosphatase family protein [Mariniphaga sp.]
MKRIVVVRHAKAVPYGYDDDFHRDLIDRGINDAEMVSHACKTRGIIPDLIMSSPATRAIKTARIFADTLNFDENQIIENIDLYAGITTREFIEIIHELPGEAGTVYFFGHNPYIFTFANNLLKHFSQDMPTCAVVSINFGISKWKDVEIRSGDSEFRITPRMLK